MYYNNRKLAMSIFWVVLGAVLMGLSLAGVLENNFYSGMGSALFVVGILQIGRNLKYRKDDDYREKIDTEFQDERNRYLRMKSWSWAGYLSIFAGAIGTVVAQLAGQRTISLVMSYSVCFLLATYWIAYLILKRKY